MATDESSSNSAANNSPSVDSYLGSVISLTSKSEIRYEGVLVSINPKEATISLQNVKSYGTEGRRKEGPQVPPSEKVYEFILFRGTDIKDLQVKSTPSLPPKQHISNDPAIIQSQYAYASPTTASSVTSAGVAAHTSSGQQFPAPGQQFPGPGEQFLAPAQQYPGLGQQFPGPGQQFLQYPGQGQQFLTPGQQFPAPGQQFTAPGQQFPSPGQQFPGPSQQFPGPSQQYSGPGPQFSGLDPGLSPGQQSQMYQTGSQHGSIVPNLPQSETLNPRLASSQYPSQSHNFLQNVDYPFYPSQPLVPSVPYNNTSALLSRNTPLASSVPSHVQTMPTPTSYNQEPSNMNHSSSKNVLPDVSFSHNSSSVPLSSLTMTSLVNTSHMPRPQQLTNAATYAHQQYPDSRNTVMPEEPLLSLPMQGEGGGSAQQFNDEFDFDAMNEKFKKDEVWGSLGKKEYNSEQGPDNHSNYHPELDEGSYSAQDSTNPANKPVYKKDDFFDTLSCNRGGWATGQNRMHEQRRLNTETFGEYQGMVRGNYGGGYYRGSYNNRGRGGGYYGGRGYRGGYRPNY